MTYRFGDFQKFGEEHIEAVTKSSSSLAKSWQAIAAESNDYAKKSFENGSAFFGKLLDAKSFEDTLQIRSEYAKSASDELGEYVARVCDLYCNLAREACKPLDAAITKVQLAVDLKPTGCCGESDRRAKHAADQSSDFGKQHISNQGTCNG